MLHHRAHAHEEVALPGERMRRVGERGRRPVAVVVVRVIHARLGGAQVRGVADMEAHQRPAARGPRREGVARGERGLRHPQMAPVLAQGPFVRFAPERHLGSGNQVAPAEASRPAQDAGDEMEQVGSGEDAQPRAPLRLDFPVADLFLEVEEVEHAGAGGAKAGLGLAQVGLDGGDEVADARAAELGEPDAAQRPEQQDREGQRPGQGQQEQQLQLAGHAVERIDCSSSASSSAPRANRMPGAGSCVAASRPVGSKYTTGTPSQSAM